MTLSLCIGIKCDVYLTFNPPPPPQKGTVDHSIKMISNSCANMSVLSTAIVFFKWSVKLPQCATLTGQRGEGHANMKCQVSAGPIFDQRGFNPKP